MRSLDNQLIKWALGGFFAYCFLLPEIFLIDKYISKGNSEMFRFYMTIIIFATMFVLLIAVIIIVVKNQKQEKRIREQGEI